MVLGCARAYTESMGALPIVLLILAMKIPIFGVMALVWWAARGYDRSEPEPEPRRTPPRRPQPEGPRIRPRRRGPHGGAALNPAPGRQRDHVAVARAGATARSSS